MRHGNPRDGDEGNDPVHPLIPEISAEETKNDAERETNRASDQRKHYGVTDRVHHFLQNRAAGRDRGPEIAVKRLPRPNSELHRKRLIKPVSLAHLTREFCRSIGRQHRHQRITGSDLHKKEANERYRKHHRQHKDQPLSDIGEHVPHYLDGAMGATARHYTVRVLTTRDRLPLPLGERGPGLEALSIYGHG